MDDIILEFLPPPKNWSHQQTAQYCQNIIQVINNQNIKYIGIPEVFDESRESKRTVAYQAKMDTVEFVELLQSQAPNVIPILYKVCVRMPKTEFHSWVKHIHEKGINHLVLVGGENHSIPYEGYTVEDAAKYLKTTYPDIQIGAITIFTRHSEVKRILEKFHTGIDFFFSQIVIEPFNLKQILHNLSKQCKEQTVKHPKIYVSLALASQAKDIEFMKWLGVEFPTAVLDYFMSENEESLEARSEETVEMILDEIFHFMKKEHLDIGFNIEHVMYNNLHLSQKLCENIKQRLASS